MLGVKLNPLLVVAIYILIIVASIFFGGTTASSAILGVTLWIVWIQLSTAEITIKELEAKLKEK